MNLIGEILMLLGGCVAVLAGVGLLRFSTPFARFHAAGKASPVAFVIAAIGAGVSLGFPAAAYLIVGSAAMVLTLPLGVHLLFRAQHRTTSGAHLIIDDLRPAERESLRSRRDADDD